MKYYADYMGEYIYAIAPDGNGVVKYAPGDSYPDSKFTPITYPIKHKNDAPWMWEENGVGAYVEEMTKEEFDTFGIKWGWENSPQDIYTPPQFWRNYIRHFND